MNRLQYHCEEKNEEELDKLLSQEKTSVERFVKFKIHVKEDTEDVLQEVYITAYKKFNQLRNKESFKAWIISIAQNKCNDYFNRQAKKLDIPIDELTESKLIVTNHGISEEKTIKEIVELLGSKDKQILYLYYWKEMPQIEIAEKLGISVGTVKSRFHSARENFKKNYLTEEKEK